MGCIFAFVNQKGGVGKTTSVINLGAYMALRSKNVLLVDFDSQGNMSSGVGISNEKPTVYEFIAGKASAKEVVRHTVIDRLDAIPASEDLSGAAIELAADTEREYYLRDALSPLKKQYDYILIDCPPSLGVLTVNALSAADKLLIPMQCEYFALEGISLLIKTVRRIQQNLNTGLSIGGIFFTMYDSRIRLANEVVKSVKSLFKDVVYSTIIPRNVRLSEAPSHGLPVCKYDRHCLGARSYDKLAEEVIARG